ncbi:M48 family metallopeptidase [Paraburkholderia sp. Ac-20340]|uniref:M48 family metallopeptidase n=1 Tax=Paraburkholderia sp. Ac-20340 TaxID=2703888 RepID=UPI001980ADB7|nr:M48 family metallopeptidase [Paraburkholderia sp. Ac-20340]MBN3858444.1 M48 family metallopeptidase [Paraburkholderia sp. Ac-20340]
MSNTINSLKNRREKIYHPLMIAAGVLLWIMVISAIGSHWDDPKTGAMIKLYVGYGVAIVIFLWIAALAYRATAFGNMILLGPKQFPELHAMVVEGASEIGLNEPPKTFLYNSHGVFNAFARRLFGGRYVFLTSALVEASSDAQVRFVIGHELGHHAAGHLNPWINTLKLPAKLIPFLGKAYSRSREYTCDNAGAYLSKDFHASRSALQMLGCGCKRLNSAMNCDAFVEQEAMVPPIFGFLTEICRSHPRLTRRVAAIKSTVQNTSGASLANNVFEPGFRQEQPESGR